MNFVKIPDSDYFSDEAQEQQKNRIMELEKTIAGLTHPRSLREIIFEFLQAVKAIHQK